MSEIAIHVEGLGKAYRIVRGQRSHGAYKTLREDLLALPRRLRSSVSKGGALKRPRVDTLWALNDVSFDAEEGEVLGIIGPNGAGKSTLLKVLSRITEPTKGRADIYGRIGSLLEVGTGFHPELTGRENVYLSGAILGMRREQIARRFDEIVQFAQVERFTETPVKRYSTGMYMRLAFAVAAHLDTEILIVDEVLAVGDAEFQKRCLGKMDAVARSGKTVLFVSHNIGAIRTLCKSAMWLDAGRVQAIGASESVTRRYLSAVEGTDPNAAIKPSQRVQGSGDVMIQRARLLDMCGVARTSYLINEPFDVWLDYEVRKPVRGAFWLLVSTLENVVLLSSFQNDVTGPVPIRLNGSISARVEGLSILPGNYVITAGIFDAVGNVVDWVEQIIRFEIVPQYADGSTADQRYGLITKRLTWSNGR
jgi:lipopolysaccharide transport system ATP-binding protein